MIPVVLQFYFGLLAFVFGAVVGSFLNVVIWRLPRGEMLSYPGSHCPKCNHKIRPWENIPILSWVFLHGRCSSCHLPISWRYPVGEALTGVLYFWIFSHILRCNLPLECAIGAFWIAGTLLAAAIIDAEHKFIPNKVTYPAIVVAVVLSCLLPEGRYVLAENAQSTSIVLEKAMEWLNQIFPGFQFSMLSMAVLDCWLGMAVGFVVLGGFAWLGRRTVKTKGRRFSHPVKAVITQKGIDILGVWQSNWEDVITNATATMTVTAEIVAGWKQVPRGTKGPLKINADGLSLNGVKLDWEYVKAIELKILGWSCPQEVMGGGDVKLMVAIGAFLGADAAIYILFCGAVLGLLFGLIKIGCALVARNRTTAVNLPLEIPFGPFLAIPALVWLFAFA